MSLNFGGINIGGNNGGGGTSDHSQLTNLDYVSAGHTGFMSSDNYIPANTTITVKQDGTGDFTNLPDAISSLTGKWSDGTVTISIAAGTYNLTERVLILSSEFNIPYLQIVGNSYTDTIINTTTTDTGIYFQRGGFFKLGNITLSGSNTGIGLVVNNVYLLLDAVVITKFATGINTIFGKVQLGSPINIQNCSVGINSARFTQVTSNASSAISFNTVTTAWKVEACGFIAPLSTNISYTSVTTKCSQTVGTINSNGFIGGTLTN